MVSCSFQELSLDGINVIGGTLTYNTDVPAGRSNATTSRSISGGTNAQWHVPWIDGEQTGTPKTPTGTNYFMMFNVKHSLNNSGNDVTRWGFGRNNLNAITISMVDNTGVITLRVGTSGIVATSTTAIPIATWTRIHIAVDHQAGGAVNVYMDGDVNTPILTYTLTAGDITNLGGLPNGFHFRYPSSQVTRICDVFAIDADASGYTDINLFAEAQVSAEVPDGEGTDQQWTGAYTDVNTLPPNANEITTNSVDQARTFTVNDSTDDRCYYVQTHAKMTRTGTGAGSNCQIRIRDGATVLDETTTAAPGSGYVIQPHQTAPDGSQWTTALANSAEHGIVTRT
jgi:hypothetical protein